MVYEIFSHRVQTVMQFVLFLNINPDRQEELVTEVPPISLPSHYDFTHRPGNLLLKAALAVRAVPRAGDEVKLG